MRLRPTSTIAKLLSQIAAAWILLTGPVFATPTVAEIEKELLEFRQFFQFRFPDLPTDQYSEGVSALPQFSRQRKGHELLLAFPPYESAIEDAGQLWKQPLANGTTLANCFAGKPPPTAYPFFFNDKLHSIESDINQCFADNGSPILDPDDEKMAALVAAWKSPYRGQPIDVDFRDEQIREYYQAGKQYFWAKRGQMNLSCANCHVHNAGNQLRGDVLSAALGHGAGYPAFSIDRFSQNIEGQSSALPAMQTLHQRYAQCNRMVGAAPLPPQSPAYLALEVYQAIMNRGLPLNAPGVRQ